MQRNLSNLKILFLKKIYIYKYIMRYTWSNFLSTNNFSEKEINFQLITIQKFENNKKF